MHKVTSRVVSYTTCPHRQCGFANIAQSNTFDMEIHGLAFGVIALFGYTAAFGAKLIIGIQRTIARDELHGFTGA